MATKQVRFLFVDLHVKLQSNYILFMFVNFVLTFGVQLLME